MQVVDGFVDDIKDSNVSIITQQVFLYDPVTQIQNLKVMLNECHENVMKTNRLLVEFNDDRLPFLPELSVKSPNKYSSIMIYLHKPT